MRYRHACGPRGHIEIDLPDGLMAMRGGRGWQGNWGPFSFDFRDEGGSRGGGRGRRARRMFEGGELRLVLLKLIADEPRHGYDLMRAIEELTGGGYSPSPGVVYPTLTMLEDMGYARAIPEEGGKKVYEITDEGRKYLAEHSTTVDDIFERIARFVEGFTDTPMMELNQAFQRLARTTYKTATSHLGEKETLERLRDIIRRAADEVEAATKQAPPAPPPAE